MQFRFSGLRFVLYSQLDWWPCPCLSVPLGIVIIFTSEAFRLWHKTNIFKVRHAVVSAWGRVVMVTIDDISGLQPAVKAEATEAKLEVTPCKSDPYT